MLDDHKQEGSFVSYINSIAKMKWRDPHINKLKYCSSAKFDEHNSKFGII